MSATTPSRNHASSLRRPKSSSEHRNQDEESLAGGERLQKVLAAAGFGSRRACEELILAGRVIIDRQKVTELGTKVDTSVQKVFVDGVAIKVERKRYFLLCKPRNVVCTALNG